MWHTFIIISLWNVQKKRPTAKWALYKLINLFAPTTTYTIAGKFAVSLENVRILQILLHSHLRHSILNQNSMNWKRNANETLNLKMTTAGLLSFFFLSFQIITIKHIINIYFWNHLELTKNKIKRFDYFDKNCFYCFLKSKNFFAFFLYLFTNLIFFFYFLRNLFTIV